MDNLEISQRDAFLVDTLLLFMKYGRSSHGTNFDHLRHHPDIAATMEECRRAEGLLFAHELVSGTLPCYFLTEKGLLAKKMGFAAYLQEKRLRERRRKRRESIVYIIEWVTVVCAIITAILEITK